MYRRAWAIVWGAATALGLGWALVTVPPSSCVGIFVVGSVATSMVWLILTPDTDTDPDMGTGTHTTSRSEVRRIAARMPWGGAAMVSFAAVLGSAPALAVGLVAAAGLSAPCLQSRLTRRPAEVPEPPAQAPGPIGARSSTPDGDRPLQLLPDRALCALWTDSFWALRRAAVVHERARVVALRASILDELERRSPQALASWLGHGPRVQENPYRFLTSGRDEAAAPPPDAVDPG